MDRSSELYVFATVVAHGNFVSAAEKCRLTPSGVSRKISRLEDRMGVKLFVRSTRKLSLTAKGEFFHSKIKQVIADIEAAESATAKQPQVPHGVLRIRCPAAFVDKHLVPLMPAFLARYPELKVEIVVGDRASTDGLLARRLETRFGLVLTGVTRPGHGALDPDPDLEAPDLLSLVNTAGL